MKHYQIIFQKYFLFTPYFNEQNLLPLIPFTHFCLSLYGMWIIHGLLGISLLLITVLARCASITGSPANVPSLSPCPAHVWYFSGRQLWVKHCERQRICQDLSGTKHLVQLLSGALGQGNAEARKVKASGCCMISCIFGELIQRKLEGFSQVLFYIGVNKY